MTSPHYCLGAKRDYADLMPRTPRTVSVVARTQSRPASDEVSSMKISDILQRKTRHSGADVVTIDPESTVRDLLRRLSEQDVGAVVVLENGAVAGIVSERDVVRRLDRTGAAVLDAPVRSIMTTTVVTCRPDDDLDDIAGQMTERRIRHMPVVAGSANAGELAGLVSIGDVVFSRIRQLEVDRGQLEQYITG